MEKGNIPPLTHQQLTQFIQQVSPFETLPISEIEALAYQITEIDLAAGAVIFNEGEIGEQCYIIYEGRVEIFITNDDKTKTILAILEPPTLFGEISVLTGAPRNASARMKEPGRLLMFEKPQLQQLIKYHVNIAESMAVISIERSRPVRNSNISHYSQLIEEKLVIILRDDIRDRYFQLSEMGWFVWTQINGKHTIQDIIISVAKKYEMFAPDVVTDTIFNLANAGFVSLPALDVFNVTSHAEPELKLKSPNFFRLHFRVDNLNQKLTTSYNKFIYLLFTPIAKLLLAIISLLGLFSFAWFTSDALKQIPVAPHLFWLLLIVLLLYVFFTIFHELGHAYTAKYYERSVARGGVIFSLLGFAAYVDTSNMWLSVKRPRIIVNLAGPLTDIIVAGLVSLCLWFVKQPASIVFLWLLALSLYYSVIKNLNPLHETDGYRIFADYLEAPKLREIAYGGLHTGHSFYSVFFYWLICLIFLGINLFIVFLLQAYLRTVLPASIWGIGTNHLTWILPALVIIYFCFTVAIGLRKTKLSNF